jgi:hypothetical protein
MQQPKVRHTQQHERKTTAVTEMANVNKEKF